MMLFIWVGIALVQAGRFGALSLREATFDHAACFALYVALAVITLVVLTGG